MYFDIIQSIEVANGGNMKTIVYFNHKAQEIVAHIGHICSDDSILSLYVQKNTALNEYKKIEKATSLIFMIDNDTEESIQNYLHFVQSYVKHHLAHPTTREQYKAIPKKWIVGPNHCTPFLLETFVEQGKKTPSILGLENKKLKRYTQEKGNKAYLNLISAFICDQYEIEESAMAIVKYEDEILTTTEQIYGKLVLSLPKGHIETGETIVDAAIRECIEETGIALTPKQVVQQLDRFDIIFINHHLQLVQKRIYPVVFEITQKLCPKPTEERIEKAEFMRKSDFLNTCTYENIRTLIQKI